MATQERLIPDTLASAKLCAFCEEDRSVYQLGDKWICTDHLAASVSLASSVWGDMVRYSKAFEEYLL